MSSNGATSMPRRANTCQSNLMFWPILSTPGSSSSGFSSAIASASRDLAGQQAAAVEEVGLARRVADRDVAGLARRDGERDADEFGLHRIERGRLGVEGDDARLVARAIQPAASRRRAPSRRRRRRSAAPRASAARAAASACGVRVDAVARGAAPAARGDAGGGVARSGRGAAPRLRRRGRASRRRRRSADRARSRSASTPQISPTRLVIVVNSIAFRNAISGSPSSFGMPSASSGVGDVDVAHQRHQLSSTGGSARPFRGWSASRGASAA